jgi:hypothetical protein
VLSIIHITSKGLFPFTDERLRRIGQYDLLSESLRAQTFTDFELVCVDAYNTLPRPELAWWLKDRARFVRPRETPWTRLGAFCAASARNTGLSWARGDTVVGLDDCYELPPTYLERVAELAAHGLYAVPGEQYPHPVAPPVPFGALEHPPRGSAFAYPMAGALACNGWPETWDGCRYGEDWAAFEYLRGQGVTFVHAPDVYLVDPGRPQHIAGQGPRWVTHRCPRALWALAAEHGWQRANEPWTANDLARLRHCDWRMGDKCQYTELPSQCGGICEWPNTPTEVALEIMAGYESRPWLDMLAARKVNGVE